jgi:hypothetical protein
MRRVALLACSVLFAAAGVTTAESLVYALDLPAGQSIAYTVDVDVRHAGTLTITGEWDGNRILAFRLLRPDGTTATRRSGPSPQSLAAEIDDAAARRAEAWTLSIRGLAGSEGGEGRLTLELPEPAPDPPPIPVPDDDGAPSESGWRLPADSPAGWLRFVRSAEQLQGLFEADPQPDTCRWQTDLIDYLDRLGAQLADDGSVPGPSTLDAMERMIRGIHEVEAMRTSSDPIIAGPVPEDPKRRRAWKQLRYDRMQDLENVLDETRLFLERKHAPELSEEGWPERLVTCVTACQRHFEQSIRLGVDRAANTDLARAQWQRILWASDALEHAAALTALDEKPAEVSLAEPPATD